VATGSAVAAVCDGLAQRAAERAGVDDFGPDSWQEGLAILVGTLESFPGVLPAGRDAMYAQYVDALWNRLRVVDYVKQHPELTGRPVEKPLFVIGLPRTGTTVASNLLDQDRGRRSLLKWEAVDSVPPPTTGRCAPTPGASR
jgi:hypothetical protein